MIMVLVRKRNGAAATRCRKTIEASGLRGLDRAQGGELCTIGPMTTFRRAIAALAPIVLVSVGASGAWAASPPAGPWGEITGERQSHTNMNRAATTIRMIDGAPVVERQPRVRPGTHTVVVHWTPKRGLRTSDRTLRVDVKPCKRYYVNAQFASPGSTLWQAIVDKVEDIPGCKAPAGTEPSGKAPTRT